MSPGVSTPLYLKQFFCELTNKGIIITSYLEGIDVLYSTNTFLVESTPIFDAIFCPPLCANQLLLPDRLASIKSLELKWQVELFRPFMNRDQKHFYDHNRRQLALQLSHIHAIFPDLRKLVVCFEDHLYDDSKRRPSQALNEINDMLLQPLAKLVKSLPHLDQPLIVELPYNVFTDLEDRASQQFLNLEEIKGHYEGVWLRYPVLPGHLAAANGSQETLGKNPCDLSNQQPSQGGNCYFYYIKEGVYSDLFWNFEGKAIRRSQQPADIGMIM